MSVPASWSTSASSNATADPSVNWQEGQPASSLNNAARAMMASQAKAREDDVGSLVAVRGSGDVYTLATNQGVPNLTNGFRVRLTFSGANTGTSPTLNIDGTGAKALVKGIALATPGVGDYAAGRLFDVTFSVVADKYVVTPVEGEALNSGYQKLWGGLIIQWGTTVATVNGSGVGNINFPVSFPTQCFTVVLCQGDVTGGSLGTNAATFVNGSFSFVQNGAANQPVRINWVAFGN